MKSDTFMGKKLKILCDVSVLDSGLNKNANRSGIYFTAYNLFVEFLKRQDVEVSIYAKIESIEVVEKVLEKLPDELKKRVVYSPYFLYLKNRVFLQNRFLKITEKINNSEFLPKKLMLRLCRKYCYIKLKNENTQILATSLQNYDCYFSFAFAIPDVIMRGNLSRFTLLYDTICLKFPHFFSAMNYDYWFKTLVRQINKNDYYFAISECTRKDFIALDKLNSDKIWSVPLAASDSYHVVNDSDIINRVKSKYNIPLKQKYIFSLCSLEPRKNLIFAVKAFVAFIKKHDTQNLFFVLGGGHWDEFIALLEKEISDLGKYKDKIIRAGYIDDEDLAVLYSDAMIFVYPSLYEGFGLPVLEAMKCGVPVITSNRSSIPEVVEDAAIMIDPNDLDTFVKALEKLYFDAEYRALLAKKGLEQCRKFSWQKTAETMVHKMRQVVSLENERA